MENTEKRKIYISGRMRGMKHADSVRLFDEAEAMLTKEGWDVYNPWHDAAKKAMTKWEEYMLYDLTVLKDMDAIYMLDNWVDSWGAKCEHAFAKGLDKQVIYQCGEDLTELPF